jgi:tryptophan halogenase
MGTANLLGDPSPADPHEERVRSILVVGGGSAGWMAATMLATAMPRGTGVQLVESEAIGTVGVGEATIPPIKKFNAKIGLDERAFMKATTAGTCSSSAAGARC